MIVLLAVLEIDLYRELHVTLTLPSHGFPGAPASRTLSQSPSYNLALG